MLGKTGRHEDSLVAAHVRDFAVFFFFEMGLLRRLDAEPPDAPDAPDPGDPESWIDGLR